WSATPDGRHDYFNGRWHSYTGMPRDGALADGWDWTEYLHPDDVERATAAWARSVATGEPYEIQYRVKEAATGKHRWFLTRAAPLHDERGRVVRWFGTLTDVDDAKHTEDALAVLARAGALLGSTLAVEDALTAVAKLAVPGLADWCAVDMAEARPDGTIVARRVAVEHRDPT